MLQIILKQSPPTVPLCPIVGHISEAVDTRDHLKIYSLKSSANKCYKRGTACRQCMKAPSRAKNKALIGRADRGTTRIICSGFILIFFKQ